MTFYLNNGLSNEPTFVSPAHFAGMTHRKRIRPGNKGSKFSSTAGNNHGKAPKLISYCPHCPITDMANPESHVHVGVSAHSKTASCRNGHRWNLVGKVY